MNSYPLYLVNAFSEGIGTGNTAAVVITDQYPSTQQMQTLARELSFSETAFIAPDAETGYAIRWFTPEVEVALCGHATMASAKVLFTDFASECRELRFASKSGILVCRKREGLIELDFPVDLPIPTSATPELIQALGAKTPLELHYAPATRNLVLVYADPETVLKMQPDFEALSKLEHQDWFGIAITAPGTGTDDYVCRYFAPWEGINEDPVTGSAQTFLAPYWADKYNKKVLNGYQASQRGGRFEVEIANPRVYIRGKAMIFTKGEVYLD